MNVFFTYIDVTFLTTIVRNVLLTILLLISHLILWMLNPSVPPWMTFWQFKNFGVGRHFQSQFFKSHCTVIWRFRQNIRNFFYFLLCHHLAQALLFFLSLIFIEISFDVFVFASFFCKCCFVFSVFYNNPTNENTRRYFINFT